MRAPAPSRTTTPAAAPPAHVALKVCGLTTPEGVEAAARAGARYVGFVFVARSPRAVAPARARDLARLVPPGIAKVGLVVDEDDAGLDAILATVPLDVIQLHGHETVARVRAVRTRGLPVMKALGIGDADDLDRAVAYGDVADQLLLDARRPPGAALPGGNGVPFDWELLAGRSWPVPWMLAGGLTPANVADAVRATGARQVDVSSGVERAPGVKDPALIAAFARALGP